MAYTTIDDPSAHFQTKVYTGSNSNQSITNDGNSDLQPDFIFASYRTLPPYTNHRAIIDSSRGRAKILESDTTDAEATTTLPAYDLVSFDTNGFTVGAVNSTSALNASGISHVAWQWKANGGTTSSNTDGAVTSTVQVNSTAGFSILTYTMNSSANETVGHGLGVAPKIVITKARERGDSNGFWSVYTTVIDGSLDYFKLNEDGYKFNSSLSAPTSTVFTGAGSSTASYRSFVAYCFAEVQGYSKFGKYVGNGNVNGPFVYTGFKPAFVLIKADSNYKYWYMFDNKRNEFNLVNAGINPSLSDAENTNDNIGLDFLSNGFKIRNSSTTLNESGTNIIFMAFAESPFTTSTGVPTTAR